MAPETPWGEQEPPGDDVAAPGVDDGVDGLVEEIARDVFDQHEERLLEDGGRPASAVTSPTAATVRRPEGKDNVDRNCNGDDL